ncbi:MAG TPA: efflux RND transporter periplasmic adaptor subunit [Blastocatellia bacterium]|nr:efflux RND transporter periplasmic adaptor subunit [Blastocatellia bacterium]
MQETIEQTKTTEHEIKASERNEHSHEPGPFRRNKRAIFIAAALLTLCLAAAVIYRAEEGRHSVAPHAEAPSASEAPPPDVAVATDEQMRQIAVEPVTERTLDVERETTGKVAFNEERMTPVFTPYAGRVLEVSAIKGAVVQSGQPLLTIESPDLVAAQNELAAARSDENKARIALDTAQTVAERARRLNEREALATKDLQQAEADLSRAKDELRRAEAAVRFVESRLALFGKNAGQLVEASNSSAPDRLVVIRAPISGTIVERKVGNGQYVKPDTPEPLFMISDLSTVWVIADVFESYLAKIRVGQSVEITVPAYPERRFPARISFINPTVDNETRMVHVRCSVPNPGGLLKPDMFARINIGTASPQPVAVVPTGAIFTKGADSFVFVEESPKRFRRRQVKPGRAINDTTIIEEGVRPGERVATRGVLLINQIIESDGGKG